MNQPLASPAVPVLELDNVCAGYQDVNVLQAVSLTVGKGQAVGLLGPNGAGKTTLLRYASGLIRGTKGMLRINGLDATGRAVHQVSRLGVCHIPEGRGIYPSLTVQENLALLTPNMSARDLTEMAVDVFPTLKTKLRRVAGTLSGGEQQMLALTRAYVDTPAVVLLDEVSMGLAPKVVDEIFASIRKLGQSSVALLMVEQYVDRALEIVDYVYVLGRGKILAGGEARQFTKERVAESYLGG